MEKIRCYEKEHGIGVAKAPYRMKYHLMPVTGWLNDPNGLCVLKDMLHVFFQYSPYEAKGGMKCWGHYQSQDWLHWEYKGTPIVPGASYDKDGIYSGSGIIVDGQIHLFYTGNVKHEGDFDFITAGREANVVHVILEEKGNIEKQEVVLSSYEPDCTCHVRDPKVWKEKKGYGMVLGARMRGADRSKDYGAVILYHSEDLSHWNFVERRTTKQPFGYMWECPDLFLLDQQEVFSFSPQGVSHQKYQFQNQYSSGYICQEISHIQKECFQEWDKGFDFYAPQTFLDNQNRRILYGWAGMPDAAYVNPTVKDGWQHSLTLARECHIYKNKVYQYPVSEYDRLRTKKRTKTMKYCFSEALCDILVQNIEEKTGNILLGTGMELSWDHGEVTLAFTDEKVGAGRTVRYAKLEQLSEIRIMIDISILEIYFNRGEEVMTTRFYDSGEFVVDMSRVGASYEIYEMSGFTYEGFPYDIS